MESPLTQSASLAAAGHFRHLARQALLRDPSPAVPARFPALTSPSDFDLDPAAIGEMGTRLPQRPAAVLVPVIARTGLTLLFTQRTDHLAAHAGQISFPGGKIDAQDAGPAATALREAEEEVGIARHHVEILGYLDAYSTGTGFHITPVVGLVSPDFTLTLNRSEVADAFEVPLPFLMDVENFRTGTRVLGGRERHFYAIPYGERYIWGATAGILKNMHERLFGHDPYHH